MEQILYYGKKPCVPFTHPGVVIARRLNEIYQDAYAIVIIEEDVFSSARLNNTRLKNKICLARFTRSSAACMKVVFRLQLFDYLVHSDPRDEVSFKLKRAREFLAQRQRIGNLERELSGKDRKLEKLILLDPLTDCYNWRYFVHRVHQELNRARRHAYNISFIAVDIDYFRQINELYGLKVADSVIKEMVGIMRLCLRREDIVCRWRDDEFFMILPYTPGVNAFKIAKRIKEKISAHAFLYKTITVRLRVSVAMIASPQDAALNSADVVNGLTKNLNAAKRQGGNVVVAQPHFDAESTEHSVPESDIEDLRERLEKMNSLLTRDLIEMIYGFAKAIEAKDLYTSQHVESTATIAERIAKELQMPGEEIEDVKRASILHDLGKVAIDDKILSKKGPLNDKERVIVQAHPWIATEILRDIHALRGSIPAILYHHERYDGTGYPLGLRGEQIPLAARIVAVADVYQALVSNRPYRKALSKRTALDIIKRDAGKHFDPRIVKVFLKLIRNEYAR